jgi:hypothetical protein
MPEKRRRSKAKFDKIEAGVDACVRDILLEDFFPEGASSSGADVLEAARSFLPALRETPLEPLISKSKADGSEISLAVQAWALRVRSKAEKLRRLVDAHMRMGPVSETSEGRVRVELDGCGFMADKCKLHRILGRLVDWAIGDLSREMTGMDLPLFSVSIAGGEPIRLSREDFRIGLAK